MSLPAKFGLARARVIKENSNLKEKLKAQVLPKFISMNVTT
tara:strand:+ start:14879 stop:15001 length:123 start_codon:yes stop_codon:yes gene_type:complete